MNIVIIYIFNFSQKFFFYRYSILLIVKKNSWDQIRALLDSIYMTWGTQLLCTSAFSSECGCIRDNWTYLKGLTLDTRKVSCH